MSDFRDFRSLSRRVERGFHRRPDSFRRRIWLAGGILSIVSVVWVALALGRGQTAKFAAGPISKAHHMFENDCAACHTTWAPVDRLLSPQTNVSSIDSEKCIKCHQAPDHQPSFAESNHVAHRFSCGECHREHRGRKSLLDIADAFCVKCHADLRDPAHGAGQNFAASIESFGGRSGRGSHPEFALIELLKSKKPAEEKLRPGLDVAAWMSREEYHGTERAGDHWQDAARIKFNHKQHLRPVDEQGRPTDGILDGRGKMRDLSQNCQACHQLDPQGRYMLPISYERHCRECHPLRFDETHFAGVTVPHDEPRVVRGFLMEKYAGMALQKQRAGQKEPAGADDFVDLPYAQRISSDLADQLREQINQAESGMPIPLSSANAEHTLLGPEARGGCRYCHEVVDPSPGELWKVVSPRIPDRWLPHSQFRHQSHSLLNCRDCHTRVDANAKAAVKDQSEYSVDQSFSTGDVLMPNIAVCRSCHTKSPQWNFSKLESKAALQSAGTHCVECHKYHPPAVRGSEP
jgi:hypothetical protein